MEYYSNRIQDYIEGLLEGEELGDFEQRLQEDEDLRNMVNLQKEVYFILNSRPYSEKIEFRNLSQDEDLVQRSRYGAVRNLIDFRKLFVIAILFSLLFGLVNLIL